MLFLAMLPSCYAYNARTRSHSVCFHEKMRDENVCITARAINLSKTDPLHGFGSVLPGRGRLDLTKLEREGRFLGEVDCSLDRSECFELYNFPGSLN